MELVKKRTYFKCKTTYPNCWYKRFSFAKTREKIPHLFVF